MKPIRTETTNEEKRCTMTDCFYNDNLECQSTSDLWNPGLLENCPDYSED